MRVVAGGPGAWLIASEAIYRANDAFPPQPFLDRRVDRRPARTAATPRRRARHLDRHRGPVPVAVAAARMTYRCRRRNPCHHAILADDVTPPRSHHRYGRYTGGPAARTIWPVPAGHSRTGIRQPLAAFPLVRGCFGWCGRSRVRTWVGLADGFTGRRHM